jgi:hypothetical protein
MAGTQTFSATLRSGLRKQAWITLPFDANSVWGVKTRHLVSGTVAGERFRGAIETIEGAPTLCLLPAWLRDNPVRPGDTVEVSLTPEGPQRTAADMDPDIAAALNANPAAATFFDSIAQFYRKAYLTWIASTKGRPEERARRIAEVISLLKSGQKQRDTRPVRSDPLD